MKIYKLIYIFILVILIIGCSRNPLDMTPNGRTTLEDIFKDNTQTGAYLNSAYGFIPPYGNFYRWNTMLAGFSDEAHDNDDPSQGFNVTKWNNGEASPLTNPLYGDNMPDLYFTLWQGIRKANIFLKYIDNANVTNSQDRLRWKTEAQLLRAFYYWELIKRYGSMPVVTEAFPSDYDYSNLGRGDFQSCIDFIVAGCDLAIASSALPMRIISENEKGRFTKAVAYMVKSEALLYNASPLWNPSNDNEKWQKAASAAQEGLNVLLNNGYALYENYGEYFLTGADYNASPRDKETIFERATMGNEYGIHNTHGIPSNNTLKAGVAPSQELVDAYDMLQTGEPAVLRYADNDHLQPVINAPSGYDEAKPYEGRDPRFYATVFYNGAYFGKIGGNDHYIQSYVGGADGFSETNRKYTHNGYYLKKYVDPNLQANVGGTATFKRFRLAELYLNYAEAENEANGATNKARDAVNAVRQRAGMPGLPTSLNQSQLRERIRNERRVELAFEEHRFWDVRRWKQLSETDKLTTGMKWTLSGGQLSKQRVVVDRRKAYFDKFLLLPLNSGELKNLPSFYQNPGY